MKTLTPILVITLLCPLALQAQNKTGLVKAIGQATETKAASALPKAAAAALPKAASAATAAQTLNAMNSQQKAATAALTATMKQREDAALRARLLGAKSTPAPSAALRSSQKPAVLQYQQQGLNSLSALPAEALKRDNRRLNLPLATALLKQYKNEIIKGYALPDNFLTAYYDRRIEPYMQKPNFTPDKSGHLYRGIFMTVDELASTLQNGFLTSMNTWTVGGNGKQFVSLSSSSFEAQSYIFQGTGNAEHPKGIGVVFVVDKDLPGLELWDDPKLNSTNTIYHCYKDVAPTKIRNVYILGEYGLESITEILIKARRNAIRSNSGWVNQFESPFLR